MGEIVVIDLLTLFQCFLLSLGLLDLLSFLQIQPYKSMLLQPL